MIHHGLLALLIEGIEAQAGPEISDVLGFRENSNFGTLPLGNVHVEVGRAPADGVELVVEMIEREADLIVFVDIVGKEEVGGLGLEFSAVVVALHFASGCVKVVALFDGGAQAIVPAVFLAGERHGGLLAHGGGVKTQRNVGAEGLLPVFLRDDVDGAADGVRTVEHRSRSLDDLDAFDLARVNHHWRAGHGLVLGNLLAVNHDERAEGVFPTDLHALDALTAVVVDLDTRDVL